jgi:hypothetical protein
MHLQPNPKIFFGQNAKPMVYYTHEQYRSSSLLTRSNLMSKCCRKKKSRSLPNCRESSKNPPLMPKHTPPQKDHPPLDAEERATIANLMKNIFHRFVPKEPNLTEPIEPRNTHFGRSRLQNINRILDARAAQCKTAYLAKQNISTLKDASGDDHLVAKKNPFASHTDQNEEPHVDKKTPPPVWDETPLIGKNESRSLRPKVDEGPRPPGRPLWMPEGTDLERMPVEVRQAVAEILRPAYEELVGQAGSGIEKSLGASLVHLLWLEILEQYDMKKDYCKFDLLLELYGTRNFAIDRYLKLVNSKLRLSSMLTRLRQLRLKEQKASSQPLNVQKQKFAHEKQPSLPDQKAPIVQNCKVDDENQTPESSSQFQTWKNHELAPKTDSSLPLPSTTFPDQNAPIMQKQEFDEKTQMPKSLNKDIRPKAQGQNVQNQKFAHENHPPLSNQKAPNMQNVKFDDQNQCRKIPSQDPNSTTQS